MTIASGTLATRPSSGQDSRRKIVAEPAPVRWLLITLAVLFLTVFLVVPLVAVFFQALSRGVWPYIGALTHPDAVAAIKLTLIVAAKIGRAHV